MKENIDTMINTGIIAQSTLKMEQINPIMNPFFVTE